MGVSARFSSLKRPFFQFLWDSRAGPVLVIKYGNKRFGLALICHREPKKCLTFLGHKSFLCSRCCGISLGVIATLVFSFFHLPISPLMGISLTIPMLLDSFSQLLGLRQSNNLLRLITGFLFSLGFLSFLVK